MRAVAAHRKWLQRGSQRACEAHHVDLLPFATWTQRKVPAIDYRHMNQGIRSGPLVSCSGQLACLCAARAGRCNCYDIGQGRCAGRICSQA